MAHKTIDPALKKKIIRYLKSHSQGLTAKKYSVSPSTVNKIANETPSIKASIDHSQTKIAVAAHKVYAKTDRMRVLNKFMGLVEKAMSGEISTGDLKNISTALGTALDKYRLEEKDMDDSSRGEASDLLTAMKKGDVK